MRQLAALVLEQRNSQQSGELWIDAPHAEQDQIKAILPEAMIAEQSRIVQQSVARVGAAVSPSSCLYNIGSSCSRSSTNAVLHINFTLEGLDNSFSSFFLKASSMDSAAVSRSSTTSSADSCRIQRARCSRHDGSIARLPLATHQLGRQAGTLVIPTAPAWDDRSCEGSSGVWRQGQCSTTFDVFETLFILKAPILSKHVPHLVEFFLDCGTNPEYNDQLRIMALNALLWTVEEIELRNVAMDATGAFAHAQTAVRSSRTFRKGRRRHLRRSTSSRHDLSLLSRLFLDLISGLRFREPVQLPW